MRKSRRQTDNCLLSTVRMFLMIVIAVSFALTSAKISQMSEWGLTFADQFALQVLETKPLANLPALNIQLANPIANVYYHNNNDADPVSQQLETHNIFGLITGNQVLFENSNSGTIGDCTCVTFRQFLIFQAHACVTSEKKGLSEMEKIFVHTHEEMHVVQFLKIKEVYEKLRERFAAFNYDVQWNIFDTEEQADIVGLLRLWEKGYQLSKEDFKVLADYSNFAPALKKLKRLKTTKTAFK